MSTQQVNNLTIQLSKAREELKNLRKQMTALKFIQRKEIAKINKTLDSWSCVTCRNGPLALPIPKNIESQFKPIGTIKSQFPRIRGTPRQPTITMNNSSAVLTLNRDHFSNPSHALEDLNNFSHLWIVFVFHLTNENLKAKVSPPRLNGKRTGVFATRSPHRPCPIGLSLVKIERIEENCVYFTGVDMVDGTPVLDIKPFIPNYDQPAEMARVPDWISEAPVQKLSISFTENALNQLSSQNLESSRTIIESVLQEDPRSIFLRERQCNPYELRVSDLWVMCEFDNESSSVKILSVEQKKML